MNKNSLPNLSIFEAEALLLEALNLLKSPGRLDPIKARLVGDFWEDGWRRAPFEECLTFKQLASIQYDTLIRKRSLDGEKMTALSYAIRRALTGSQTVEAPRSLEQKLPQPVVQPETEQFSPQKSAAPVFETPVQLLKDLAPTAAALYRGLREIVFEIPEDHPLCRPLRKLFSDSPAPELTAYWLETVHGETAAIELLGEKETKISRLCKSARKEVSHVVQEHAPDVFLHWTTALTGAGASIGHLTRIYTHARGVNRSFIEAACIMLLSGIGAKEVHLADGLVVPGHFSFSPSTAGKIVSALKISPKSSTSSLREIMSLPFPFFDSDVLIETVKQNAKVKKALKPKPKTKKSRKR